MRKLIKMSAFAAAIVAAAMLSSCENQIESVEKDLPTSLTIRISAPAPVEVSTRATDLQETNVTSLALFFYRKDNYLDHPKAVITLDSEAIKKVEDKTPTNYVYTLTVQDDELTSGDYYLYAIANYNTSNFGQLNISELSSLSLDALKSYLVENTYESSQMTENSLLMTGVFGRGDGSITLQPENNNITSEQIHLRRIVSKINFSFVNGTGVSFVPKTYSICGFPLNCTLFERYGWTNKNGVIDNVSGTFPGNFAFKLDPEVNTQLLDIDCSGSNSFSFYMYESAQPNGIKIEDQRSREIHNLDYYTHEDSSTEFLNAPENAAYVVISGIYNGPGKEEGSTVSGNVSYTIHLGDFSTQSGSFDNFTVRRNTKYNYRVTVTSVNSIITEATAGEGADYSSIDSGAEGDILNVNAGTTNITVDSHYETVMVKMPKFSSDKFSLKVITPKVNSIYSSTAAESKTAAESERPADVSWIKFVKPTSSTALPKYPGSGKQGICDIYTLLADIEGGTQTYYLESGDYYYTAAFVDEYFYDDIPLTEFVNAADREMTLASGISVSADGKSSYAVTPIFSIKQQSIKSMYNLSLAQDGYNPFGIEILEEFPAVTWSGSDRVDGDGGVTDNNSDVNGWANSTNYWNSSSWSDFIVDSNFGHFDNNTYLADGAVVSGKEVAKFQCISRNRDEDGDGVIDESEVKWYLPAVEQCLAIWYGYPALGGDAKLNIEYQGYFTSTFGSGSGNKRVWYIDEGASFGYYADASWLRAKLGVRCVRTLASLKADPTPVSSYDASTHIISLSTLDASATRPSGSQSAEYLAHVRNEEPDQLPQAFEVAKNLLSSVTLSGSTKTGFTFSDVSSDDSDWCNTYYTQDTETAGQGRWRIPNEREFGLMVKHLGDAMLNTRARTVYYRRYDGTPVNAGYVYLSEGGNTVLTTSNGYSSRAFSIRCVRDAISPSTANN
ncbi:MAG: fimbrial protein [Candidatus Cryptobacteroides sp.]